MPLTPQQIEAIKREADVQERALSELSKSAVTLWKSKLNMAIAVENIDTVSSLIEQGTVASWGDNNCACRAPIGRGAVVRPL